MKAEEINDGLATIAGKFYVLSQEYIHSPMTASKMQKWEEEFDSVATEYEALREQAGE
jgi:predicted molibdopterin-dependent oxidoreductase YjgC